MAEVFLSLFKFILQVFCRWANADDTINADLVSEQTDDSFFSLNVWHSIIDIGTFSYMSYHFLAPDGK